LREAYGIILEDTVGQKHYQYFSKSIPRAKQILEEELSVALKGAGIRANVVIV